MNTKRKPKKASTKRKQFIQSPETIALVRAIKEHIAETNIALGVLAKVLQLDNGNFSKILKGERDMPPGRPELFEKYVERLGGVTDQVNKFDKDITARIASLLPGIPASLLAELPAPLRQHIIRLQEERQRLSEENVFYQETIILNLRMLTSKVTAMQSQLAYLQEPNMGIQPKAEGVQEECDWHEPMGKATKLRRVTGSKNPDES